MNESYLNRHIHHNNASDAPYSNWQKARVSTVVSSEEHMGPWTAAAHHHMQDTWVWTQGCRQGQRLSCIERVHGSGHQGHSTQWHWVWKNEFSVVTDLTKFSVLFPTDLLRGPVLVGISPAACPSNRTKGSIFQKDSLWDWSILTRLSTQSLQRRRQKSSHPVPGKYLLQHKHGHIHSSSKVVVGRGFHWKPGWTLCRVWSVWSCNYLQQFFS